MAFEPIYSALGVSGYSGATGVSGYSGTSGYSGAFAGTGTSGYIPRFTGASSLGNSLIQDDGMSVTVNASTLVQGALSSTNVISDPIGSVRWVPQTSQSAAYTLTLTDAGKHILHPSTDTSARTFTIPDSTFSIGTAITFVNQNGAGVLTITTVTDTMRLAGPGTTGSRTLAANGVATALKIAATEWIISGASLT